MTAIKALLVISLLLNVFLGICAIYEASRRKKELEAQRPVLNLWNFRAIYNAGIQDFGKENARIIARICVRTARFLNARMHLEDDLLRINGDCEVASKACTTALGEESREHALRIYNLETERDAHDKRSTEMKEIYELINSTK